MFFMTEGGSKPLSIVGKPASTLPMSTVEIEKLYLSSAKGQRPSFNKVNHVLLWIEKGEKMLHILILNKT